MMMSDSEPGASERATRNPPTIDLDPSQVTVNETTGAKTNSASDSASDTGRSREDRDSHMDDPSRRPWSGNASNALIPALSGATAAALILTAAWLLGLSGDNRASVPATAAVPASDSMAAADLTARLAKLETAVATRPDAPAAASNAPDPAMAKRVDQADASIKSITQAVAALRADVDKLSASVRDATTAPREAQAQPFDSAPLEQRMMQIETAQRTLAQAVQQAAKPFDDAPLRRALAASVLDSAFRSGEPFADVLAAAKASAPSASLQVLDSFAATGVPNDAALSRELAALLPQLSPAQPKPAVSTGNAGSVLDRLQESAARLVKVERADQATAEQPASTAKIAAAARSGDIAAAKAAVMELPSAQRAPAQVWLDRVQARDAARETVRQFASAQIAALPNAAR